MAPLSCWLICPMLSMNDYVTFQIAQTIVFFDQELPRQFENMMRKIGH